jgi:hypothetical protein
MGNKSPTTLPLAPEQQACIGRKYRTLTTLYLQKSMLAGSELQCTPLPAEHCTDAKFGTFQHVMPPGCLLEVTHAALPRDVLGFGYFGPVRPTLRGTISQGEKSLADVKIAAVLGVKPAVLVEV